MKKNLIKILVSAFILGSCLIPVNAVSVQSARYGHGGETIYGTKTGEKLGLAYQWNNSAKTEPFTVYAETDSSPNVSKRIYVSFLQSGATDVDKTDASYASTSISFKSIPSYKIQSLHAITKVYGNEGTANLSYSWNDGSR